ncbi:hypothetical protein MRB53_038736 [Persea americana]|nr:hypothetical protein MRB53_038736 [Persea americana]
MTAWLIVISIAIVFRPEFVVISIASVTRDQNWERDTYHGVVVVDDRYPVSEEKAATPILLEHELETSIDRMSGCSCRSKSNSARLTWCHGPLAEAVSTPRIGYGTRFEALSTPYAKSSRFDRQFSFSGSLCGDVDNWRSQSPTSIGRFLFSELLGDIKSMPLYASRRRPALSYDSSLCTAGHLPQILSHFVSWDVIDLYDVVLSRFNGRRLLFCCQAMANSILPALSIRLLSLLSSETATCPSRRAGKTDLIF